MQLHLSDIENKKEIKVKIAIEYAIPVQDLIIAFYSKNQTCGLYSGKQSSPYDHYDFRKVIYIVGGKFEYKKQIYFAKIGHYTSKGKLVPFLIDAENDAGEKPFVSSYQYDDNFHADFKLIDYKEFQVFSWLFNRADYSFKDFVSENLNGKLNEHHYSLFNVFPKEKNDTRDFLTHKGFDVFLDEEEKRTEKQKQV